MITMGFISYEMKKANNIFSSMLSLNYHKLCSKVLKLKLYLQIQKWILNRISIFLKIVLLAFNSLQANFLLKLLMWCIAMLSFFLLISSTSLNLTRKLTIWHVWTLSDSMKLHWYSSVDLYAQQKQKYFPIGLLVKLRLFFLDIY